MTPWSATGLGTVVYGESGAASGLPIDAKSAYRCIWPAERPALFSGVSCSGEPDFPCLVHGPVISDRHDRIALPHASASWECAVLGARLPTVREYRTMAGLGPMNEPTTWLSTPFWDEGGPTYGVAAWAEDWTWGSATNRVSSPQVLEPFRCVATAGTGP